MTGPLIRQRLLDSLNRPQHTLLSAPPGYGKSGLLAQYGDHLGVAPISCAAQDDAPGLLARLAPGADTLLLDDAHRLRDQVVDDLLATDPARLRVVLAGRHALFPAVAQRYGRQLQLLDAADLAFTADDLGALGLPGDQIPSLLAQTLGWPVLCALASRPPLAGGPYLLGLYGTLPSALREWVGQAAQLEGWATSLLLGEGDGLRELLVAGVPLIRCGARLELHPALRGALQGHLDLARHSPEHEQLVLLTRLLAETAPPALRLPRIELFFEQRGDDDLHAELKVQLLSGVPRGELSPLLRDHLAYYLLVTLDVQTAERVLMFQQEWGTTSTRTYTLLARIASRRNDFTRYREALTLARTRIESEADHVRALVAEANYEARMNNFAGSLEKAEQAYQAATRAGNTELHILALLTLCTAHQMLGQLVGAIRAAQAALSLSQGQGHRFVRQTTALHSRLAEMTKDAGDHAAALAHVQQGLQLQLVAPHPSVPYLYAVRGLIHTELGELEAAVVSFEASLRLFEQAGNVAGTLMPRAHLAYALYRLGWGDRIEPHLEALREVAERSGPAFSEHHAFIPLAQGLWQLSQGDENAAIAAFQTVSLDGTLTYDSVLLIHLLLGDVLARRGEYTRAHLQTLLNILDARSTPDDATAAAYAHDFTDLLRACVRLNVQPERFRRLLGGVAAPRAVPRPRTVIRLSTLGTLSLEIGGTRVSPRSHAPLYALAWLAYQPGWTSADELGRALFGDLQDARRTAIQAVSNLRRVLRDVDQELLCVLSDKDARGYRLRPGGHVVVEADFTESLRLLTPANPNTGQLRELLAGVQPFLPGTDSAFAREVNDLLADRAVAVATFLAGQYRRHGNLAGAAEAALLGLRVVDDPGLGELYLELRAQLPAGVGLAGDLGPAVRAELAALARQVQGLN